MTGEISQWEAENAPEWETHRAIARELNGEVHAFDAYQGPYITAQRDGRNLKLWIAEDDAGPYVYDEYSDRTARIAGYSESSAIVGALELANE